MEWTTSGLSQRGVGRSGCEDRNVSGLRGRSAAGSRCSGGRWAVQRWAARREACLASRNDGGGGRGVECDTALGRALGRDVALEVGASGGCVGSE